MRRLAELKGGGGKCPAGYYKAFMLRIRSGPDAPSVTLRTAAWQTYHQVICREKRAVKPIFLNEPPTLKFPQKEGDLRGTLRRRVRCPDTKLPKHFTHFAGKNKGEQAEAAGHAKRRHSLFIGFSGGCPCPGMIITALLTSLLFSRNILIKRLNREPECSDAGSDRCSVALFGNQPRVTYRRVSW